MMLVLDNGLWYFLLRTGIAKISSDNLKLGFLWSLIHFVVIGLGLLLSKLHLLYKVQLPIYFLEKTKIRYDSGFVPQKGPK